MRPTFRPLLVMLVPLSVTLGATPPDTSGGFPRGHTIQPDLPEIREAAPVQSTSPCDLNGDRCLDLLDLLLYIPRWQMGDALADTDGDGDISVVDLLRFVDCVLASDGGV